MKTSVDHIEQEWRRLSRQDVAVMLHYPRWSMSELEKQRAREEKHPSQNMKADIARDGEQRKIYLKTPKVNQMRLWVHSLVDLNPRPNFSDFEYKLLDSLYAKFSKYRKHKWVTQKQYDALRSIAFKYLGEQFR